MAKSKASEIQHGLFRLQKSQAVLYPFEVHLNAFTLSHILTWSLCMLHTTILFALACSLQREGPTTPWQIWIALLAELSFNIPEAMTALTILLALFSGKAAQPRPAYRLEGHVAPAVDIMITCCGEPVEILINTISAAAAQDYPIGRSRVFVLDDGHDAELQQAVAMLKLRLGNITGRSVIYLSRTVPPGQPSHFKSGNLRFGIEESQRLGTGSDFVAGLDADMVPEPNWLRSMVPHVLLQDEVAMACGPQSYYNVPPSDPLGQQADFDIYFTVQELLNDCLGAPMCTGTGYVAKRSAIAEIGGWPLAFTGEDYMCSALLTGAGWEVVFVREPLQSGLAPESLTAAMKQRMRWTDAGLEVHQRLGPYIRASGLTARMKLSTRAVNMAYIIRDYSPMTTVLAMALLPLVLIPMPEVKDLFNSIAVKHATYLVVTRRLFLATHLARSIHKYATYRHIDPSHVANVHSMELWSAPYSAYCCAITLLSLLPFQRKNPTVPNFTVCGTIISPTNERSAQHRASLLSRLTRTDTSLYILYVIYAAIPLFHRLFLGPPFPFPSLLLKLLACVIGVSKPVSYMIWPPTAPGWDALTVEDGNGIKRPRRAKGGKGEAQGWTRGSWLVGLSFDLLIIWLCSVA